MKAYEPIVSVSDPKQRRTATELTDYVSHRTLDGLDDPPLISPHSFAHSSFHRIPRAFPSQCNGDRFKLFSKAENRAVDVLDVGGRRLKSVPSAGLRA